MRQFRIPLLCIAALVMVISLAAQPAISTKAGMVNYFEGTVLMDGEKLEYSVAKFHQIPNGGTLEAPMNGRAEVLLSPGVLLWLGEGSKIELVSNDLVEPQVRLLAGNAVVSSTDFPKDASVTLLINDESVKISDSGIYRLDYSPAQLQVTEGQADVLRAGLETRVKKGRSLMLDEPGASLARIDKNEPADSLLMWAESRDSYIQVANLSSARQAQQAGGFYGTDMAMLGAYQGFGGWMYNPYFGMFTLVPFRQGIMMSPFGNMFWSPFAARQFYTPLLSGGGYGWQRIDPRALNSRNSVARGGFSNNAAFGSYSRGASSGGRNDGAIGGRGAFGTAPSRGFGGSMGGGGYSRGASAGGSVGGGGAVSAPSSSGGASMGRGGASAGRSGGGGRGN